MNNLYNYKNKKILITGGAGFIGSHMVKELLKLNAKITVTVKYNSVFDCIRLSNVWKKIKVIECDLRNTDSVINSLGKLNFDFIFHLAAYNHVGDSFKYVKETIDSNLYSTINILNNGPKYQNFIHMGTSEIYGFQKKSPFSEKSIPEPNSPYAISKYASEGFALLKKKETNKNILLIRPFNTFGTWQSEKAIIPEIIIKCLKNESIKTTPGLQEREFNFVSNIIKNILYLSIKKNNYKYKYPINVGSGKSIKIKNLVKKIKSLTNSESKLNIGGLNYRPNEIWNMKASTKIMRKFTMIKNQISFEDGLKLTIDWYKNFFLEKFKNDD